MPLIFCLLIQPVLSSLPSIQGILIFQMPSIDRLLLCGLLWMCLPLSLNANDGNLADSEDFEELAFAVFRVQDTYQLTTNDVISRIFSDLETNGGFSARSCYNIAMIAIRRSDFYHALMWLQEAEIRLQNEAKPSVSILDVWRPLVVSLHEQGNPHKAHTIGMKLKYILGRTDMDSAIMDIAGLHDLLSHMDDREIGEEVTDHVWNNRTVDKKTEVYEEMCREGHQEAFQNPQLYCLYRRNTSFLRLAPAKVEYLHLEPVVLLFRDIISDSEIQIIQSLAGDKLSRGKVFRGKERTTSEKRTSTTTWVHKKEHPLISKLHQRISAYTGLDIRQSGDPLQVAQYGMGGHYFLHYDYMREKQRAKFGYHGSYNNVTGDRLATFMFYLSSSDGGGSTVFPHLSLSIPPSKNDAVFWYNLRKDGSGHYEALHGGCPVISGTKWVANQWIRERGQEFARPCGLLEDRRDDF